MDFRELKGGLGIRAWPSCFLCLWPRKTGQVGQVRQKGQAEGEVAASELRPRLHDLPSMVNFFFFSKTDQSKTNYLTATSNAITINLNSFSL
jgi:hypothetical protein